MARYLMDAGYRLHLSNNVDTAPRLCKAFVHHGLHRIKSIDTTHDVVLQLHEHGVLVPHSRYPCGDESFTILEAAPWGE